MKVLLYTVQKNDSGFQAQQPHSLYENVTSAKKFIQDAYGWQRGFSWVESDFALRVAPHFAVAVYQPDMWDEYICLKDVEDKSLMKKFQLASYTWCPAFGQNQRPVVDMVFINHSTDVEIKFAIPPTKHDFRQKLARWGNSGWQIVKLEVIGQHRGIAYLQREISAELMTPLDIYDLPDETDEIEKGCDIDETY